MKKTILIIICGFITICLAGCNNKIPLKYGIKETKTFIATIIECNENSMIVIPNQDEDEYKSSDKFRIEFAGDYNSCQESDKVKVTYVGGINESYPAQIDTIKIESLKK